MKNGCDCRLEELSRCRGAREISTKPASHEHIHQERNVCWGLDMKRTRVRLAAFGYTCRCVFWGVETQLCVRDGTKVLSSDDVVSWGTGEVVTFLVILLCHPAIRRKPTQLNQDRPRMVYKDMKAACQVCMHSRCISLRASFFESVERECVTFVIFIYIQSTEYVCILQLFTW